MNEMEEKSYQLMDFIKTRVEKFSTDWSIKAVLNNENQIRFSENQIDINKNWNEIKIILFLSHRRRTLDIVINDLRPEAIDKALLNCKKLLNMAKLNINYKKMPEGPFDYKRLNIYDEKVVNLDEIAVDLVSNATEAALNEGANRVAGSFFHGFTQVIQSNSLGLIGSYNKTFLNFRIRTFAKDMYATGEAISCSSHIDHGFSAIDAGREAGMICTQAVGGKKGKPGLYNIIIYPKVSTELQSPTPSIAMNRYTQKMGLAWLVGKKEGDKIANNNISVWDDGTIDYGLASSPYDDELVPRKKTLLINKGKIHQFFTNTSLSKKEQESTGNAGITVPEPTNTVFSIGDYSLEELMEISDKPTLLITSTWYTRYQSYAPPGALSSLPKDGMFLVKNKGKELEPVRELRINSDHYHMLEHTIALGKELKQVSTWLGTNPVFAPYMLIEDIKMTTGTK